ncbi:contactin-like [Octopus sinensis]|uniref:Contactin-like n=1 Tax=Octopus sinensis TaxID=2607531 RepID=A0A6P7SBI9_9MOLL|nr:contactin-like [Octopus sinensis]
MLISLTFVLYYVYAIIPSVGSRIFDCPSGWETYINHCYKYVRYPKKNFHEASLACKLDGAALVKVEDFAENEFIKSKIKQYSRSLQWYTDATVNDNVRNLFVWRSSGNQIRKNLFWIDETEMQREGSSIIYSQKGNMVGWSRSPDTAQLSYICEISRVEAFPILKRTRDYGYGKLLRNRNEIRKGPTITIDAADTVIIESSKYIFLECVADGNPRPVYKWHRFQDNTTVEVTALDSHYTLTNGRLIISNPIDNRDAGYYQCSAENEFGKVMGNIVLLSFAYLGDFSNVIPEPVYADAYESTSIHCSHISFKPAITYQWVIGDMNFVRTTKQKYMFISRNGQLYFSEVSSADMGEYRCLATLFIKHHINDVDHIPSQLPSRISNAIRLIVRNKISKGKWGPVIHNDFIAAFPTQPTIGDDVYLECFAQGSSDDSNKMIYSWSKVDGKFSDRVILSDLNRVLLIKEARWEDEGQYKCTVQSQIAQDERVYSLRFQNKPIMSMPLKPQFVDIDSKVVWHCEAFSKPNPSYTWYKNGILLRTSEDVVISANILIINVAKKGHHDGMYQCVAKNKYGTTYSSAQLSVLAFKPNFLRSKALTNIKGAMGGNITLLCEAEGAPQPNITWKQKGKEIMNDLTASRIQQLPNGYLRIQKLNANDQGIYSCTASNKFGQATLTFNIVVTEALVITTKPQNTEVNVNETATLRCDASYNPSMDTVHEWFFNDIKIDFENNQHFSLSAEDPVGGLVIRNARIQHSGYYTCIVKSTINKIKARAFLSVKGAPGEVSGLAADGENIGRSSVHLKWVPPPDNGFPISIYTVYSRSIDQPEWKLQRSKILMSSIRMDDTGFHSVTISGLHSNQDYQFCISAANIEGVGDLSRPSSYIRTLSSPPLMPPKAVTGGGGKVKTLVIEWSPLEIWEQGGPGIGYSVYWRLKTNIGENWSNERIRGSLSSFVTYVADKFYTEYEVKIQAFNDFGFGPNSTIHTIFSAEDMPLGVPVNVFAADYNGTAMDVTWDPVSDTREVMRGRVQGYQVNYWDRDKDEPIRYSVRQYNTEGKTVVIGLLPNAYYLVTVQVFNTAGLGPVSETYLGTTGMEAPGAYPTEVNVYSHGPDSVLVTFRGVTVESVDADTVSGYKLCCWKVQEKYDLEKCIEVGLVSQYVVTGLEKHFLYNVRVMASSAGGDGKRSEATYFTLGGQIPFDQSQFDVLATASNLSAIKILIVASIIINFILQL